MDNHKGAAGQTAVFSPITAAQIEKVNIRRIIGICAGTLAFEGINLLNPAFWATPILWSGAIYLTAVSIGFLAVLLLKKPAAAGRRPAVLNSLFWVLFSVGFFPFLVRDARGGDSPLNCVLLCTVLICAPLLRVKNLSIIFGVSLAVNLLAAWYARGAAFSFQYALELIAINAVGYSMARNLHGRYFALLDEQQKVYDQQLADRLRQEALQSKLEQDRQINAARSEFLSRMSHDLRTPLNAVIGLSDMAMDEALAPEEVRTCLGDINDAAKHLLSLINDVLDMTKLDNNKMTLRPAPYETAAFLSTVRSVIGAQCTQRQLRLSTECDDGFPACLLVDRLRFNQIFLNLLSNAVKFTPAGGEVALRLTHAPAADGQIALTAVVHDTGRGMEPDFAAHAFEAFTQERAEDGERGAGLGLTIVRSIVRLMEGTIRVESCPGRGTDVTVCMTVGTAAPAAPENRLAAAAAGLSGKRVLLCEDNLMNQKVAVYLLERVGMTVETAADGARGVALFSGHQAGYYDAVLMDVRMPVMDGIAAAAAIRALGRADAAAVPIIAMTANAYEEDEERSKAAGMNAHLSKPVDPQALYAALTRFLSGDGAQPRR